MQGFFRFPHYTWGYIVVKNHECKSHHVPSLYVRVYRIYNSILTHKTRSLTIREGISYKTAAQIIKDGFPHYTWGYIDLNPRKLFLLPVPSLYVRVYRQELFSRLYAYCSLTIREGISPILMADYILRMFPHYTWGYISVYTVRLINDGVPSLYVRVYRYACFF